jgi:MinD superfamily P-loop ATPase
MKHITVISGKGGTGKTSLVGAFASLARNVVLADCDVDAANLHLLICDPQVRTQSEPFMSGVRAVVDPGICTGCGWCESVCRFGAIHVDRSADLEGGGKACVELLSCEGCGTCSDGCPASAVQLREHQAGELLVTRSRFGPLVHARLMPGEGSSGKLVTKVRTRAKAVADSNCAELVLVDGSPGIGCPVIASITGVDGVLIVTEPTLSGKSDLERVLDLCRHFNVPACVLINKYDLNEEITEKIREMCRSDSIPLLGTLRFDPSFVDAVVAGKTIMELDENGTALQIRRLWSDLLSLLGKDISRT